MASRGLSRLRSLWATCQGIPQQHRVQSGCMNPSSARVFSAQSKVFSPQSTLFPAESRVFSAQYMVFSRYSSVQAAAKEPASTEGKEGEAVKKKRKNRKKTFMEVAQFLPEWGQGCKFTKSHWHPGNFYKVTKVKVYKSGRHGAAWGIFHEDQAVKTGETEKIGGVNKRCWRYIPDGDVAAVVWKQSAAKRPVKHVPLTTGEIANLTFSSPVVAG